MPVGEMEVQGISADDRNGRKSDVVRDLVIIEDLFTRPLIYAGRARARAP